VSLLFTAKAYLKYLLKAKNLHGVHSPFVYNFNEAVLNDNRHFYAYEQIQSLRKKLIANNKTIIVQDYGAGSHYNKSNKRTISSIAKQAAKQHKHGKLLFKIINYYKPKILVELGTSLGIGASYMALANSAATLHTIEGSAAIAEEAKNNFNFLNINNVVQYTGTFAQTLPQLLTALQTIDFLFIDGHHAYEPTLQYFELCKPYLSKNAIVIFDDIYWSPGMQAAWQKIKEDSSVMLTIDIFQFGIVFYGDSFIEKEHFTLKL
jgi:predicted O-methyltransferase YrrM